MTLSRAWLLGVALGALGAGTSSAHGATPDIEFVRNGSDIAIKSWIFDPVQRSYTGSETSSESISTSLDLRKKLDILQYAWSGKTKCSPPKPEHIELPQKKTVYAVIHAGTSMGVINGCGDALYKLQDVYYKLATTKAIGKVDYVKATLIVPFYHGYRVTIHVNLNVSIGP